MPSKWVSVTGSRYYPFTAEVWKGLSADEQLESIQKGVALVHLNIEQFPQDWGIVSGGARGPDTWAAEFAQERGHEVVIYKPDWKKDGPGAGFARNKLIAQHADSCLVFWDGESNGTNDFIRKAFKLRRNIWVIGPTGTPWAIWDEDYWDSIDEDKPPKMDIPRG